MTRVDPRSSSAGPSGSEVSVEPLPLPAEVRMVKMCDKCFRYLHHYPRIDACHWVNLNCDVCRGANVKMACEFKVGICPVCPRGVYVANSCIVPQFHGSGLQRRPSRGSSGYVGADLSYADEVYDSTPGDVGCLSRQVFRCG